MKKILVGFSMVFFVAWGIFDIMPAHSESIKEGFIQAKAKYSGFRQSIKDFTIVQDMEMDTADGLITVEAKLSKKAKKYRIDLNSGSTVIFDGKKTWMISPSNEKKEISYPESKKYQRDSTLWDFLLENGQVVRQEVVGTFDCFVAEVKDERQLPYTLWVEKGTFDLIQAESAPTASGKINLWNSDFRKIDGDWDIPYRMEVYLDNKLQSTVTVKTIQVNQGLKDDLFNPDLTQEES